MKINETIKTLEEMMDELQKIRRRFIEIDLSNFMDKWIEEYRRDANIDLDSATINIMNIKNDLQKLEELKKED